MSSSDVILGDREPKRKKPNAKIKERKDFRHAHLQFSNENLEKVNLFLEFFLKRVVFN